MNVKKLIKNNQYILSFCHSNVLVEAAGVEKYILNQSKILKENNIDNIIVFPLKNSDGINNVFLHFYGVIINNQYIGAFKKDELLLMLYKIKTVAYIIEIHLHHTKNYDLEDLDYLFENIICPIKFFAHDFYSVCPTVTMLNDLGEFCGSEMISNSKCLNCSSRENAKKHFAKHKNLFLKYKERLTVIFPSNSTKEIWMSSFNFVEKSKTKVISHLKFSYVYNGRKSNNNDKLKVAFVGAPNYHKGWDLFKYITEKVSDCEFYHFGYSSNDKGNWLNIPVSYLLHGEQAMTNMLKATEIDIVLMLTRCAETYCYTLYESILANTMLICLNHPGNVKDVIVNNDLGLCYDNVDEIIDYLNTVDKVNHDLMNKYSKIKEYEIKSFVNDELMEYIDKKCISSISTKISKMHCHLFINAFYQLKILKRKISLRIKRGG